MAKKEKLGLQKTVNIKNRKATHEYQLLDKYTAGIVLKGTEIKSIRMGKVTLTDAFCMFIDDELIIRDMHISPYEMGTSYNHEAKTDRKLLLNKRELKKLQDKSKDVGAYHCPNWLVYKR